MGGGKPIKRIDLTGSDRDFCIAHTAKIGSNGKARKKYSTRNARLRMLLGDKLSKPHLSRLDLPVQLWSQLDVLLSFSVKEVNRIRNNVDIVTFFD